MFFHKANYVLKYRNLCTLIAITENENLWTRKKTHVVNISRVFISYHTYKLSVAPTTLFIGVYYSRLVIIYLFIYIFTSILANKASIQLFWW